MKPLIVVEGSDAQFDRAVGDVRARGWSVVLGWPHGTPPVEPAPAAPTRQAPVFAGAVTGPDDAAAAVSAVVGGAGIVAYGLAEPGLLGALCDDLRHLGRLDHRIGDCRVALAAQERDLLELLLAGCTIAAAASRLYLSRRSVERRLMSLRERFGVATVVELMTGYRDQLEKVPLAPAAG